MLNSLQALTSSHATYGPLKKIAIIDVGSNSFRLIVVTYVPNSHFQVTDEVRETVRLVQGLGATGKLSSEAMDYAVEVMRLYASFCRASEISDIVAVATSAVREASNREEFLARVQRDSGISVRLLSGGEEAYYGYLAAVNSTTLRDGYVFDIGGGSMQITRVANRRNFESASFTLGAVRTTEEWLPNAPADKEAVNRLRRHLRAEFGELSWLRAVPNTRLVGQGGSLRNVARLAQKQNGYPMEELHGYRLTQDDVRKIIRILEPLTNEQRRALPGMKPDRADITLAAAIVIEELMKNAGYEEMTVCSQGLREGVFYERFLAANVPPLFSEVRRASVMNIAHLYRYQEKHAWHVAHLALSMFDAIRDMWLPGALCGDAERELLWAACMLHDIGMTVDYNDHHRHSYYLILNSGLPGYTHRELALIALATRFHRKGRPEAYELAGVLEPEDWRRLNQMTALLRLAEQLDRSRDGSVRDVRLWQQDGRIKLEVISEVDVSVAIWSAQLHLDVFQTAFGRPLDILHVE